MMKHDTSKYSILPVVLADVSLAGIFALALWQPQNYLEFIYQAAPLIFVFEFFSIHASGMLAGSIKIKRLTAHPGLVRPLLIGYFVCLSLIVGVNGLIVQSWQLPLTFLVSTGAKFFGARAASSESRVRLQAILLVATFIIAALGTGFISQFIPFPEDVASKTSAVSSWSGNPQILLLWGTLYFLGLAILELVFSNRKSASRDKKEAVG